MLINQKQFEAAVNFVVANNKHLKNDFNDDFQLSVYVRHTLLEMTKELIEESKKDKDLWCIGSIGVQVELTDDCISYVVNPALGESSEASDYVQPAQLGLRC